MKVDFNSIALVLFKACVVNYKGVSFFLDTRWSKVGYKLWIGLGFKISTIR